jgi:hypothetical protein|tara:strand:+ start:41 stop:745 length:705 start_codon:yes stop_codon:yes gene_type:complete
MSQDHSNKKTLTFPFVSSIYYEKKNLELSRLCDKYGSDKGSNDLTKPKPYKWHPHTYTDFYSTLFGHCRENFKRIFECGIGTNDPKLVSSTIENRVPGASLRVWRDYFFNATIFGADIDKNILFNEEKIQTYYVDQTKSKSIKKMWDQIGLKDFDLIIDDGLHTLSAGITLFKYSIDNLKKNGLYIIEDVGWRYMGELVKYFNKQRDIYNYELVILKSEKMNNDNNLMVIRRIQ